MTRIGHNGGPSLPPQDSGWIAITRSMRNHPIVGFHLHVKPADPEMGGAMQPALAFIDLIMECRYDAGYVMNGGRKMLIQRGQLVGAVSWLAARWNWTPKTVRGFLDRLENDGMIERVRPGIESGQQKGKQANLLSVCNYDKYQRQTETEGQATGPTEGKQGASKGQAEGHIYKDNKGTKEQGNNTLPSPAHVQPLPEAFSPRDDDGGEIEGLNGATFDMVDQLAICLNQINPDKVAAKAILADTCRAYGGDAAKVAFADLLQKVRSGQIKRPSIRMFDGFARQASLASKRASTKHVPRDNGETYDQMMRRQIEEMQNRGEL